MKKIDSPEDSKDHRIDRLMYDVMQQRAKMAITHSNAKLAEKWRERIKEEENGKS